MKILEIYIPMVPVGTNVIEAKGVAKAYGEIALRQLEFHLAGM
jgi:hypothetical protein